MPKLNRKTGDPVQNNVYIGDDKNYVILQDYIEGAEAGDVRIMMLNGEPIGAMRHVPVNGDVRSNIHSGGNGKEQSQVAEQRT